MTGIALALLAGMLTIAAPCILPMLPILLGTSVGRTSRARPAFIALGFTLSFAVLALVFGLFSSALGLDQDTLRNVAIVLLMSFGILMVWPRPFELMTSALSGVLNRVSAIGDRAGNDNIGGFILGMTLGAVWTPCAGPVLGSILTLVVTAQDLSHATLLLVCYAVGASVPMLAIAYGGQYMTTRVRKLARYSHRMQQAFGVLIVLTSAAMYYQYDTLITVWLSNFYPDFGQGL
jgi:cytochrome c biogenesis protein CcdA